MMAIKDSNNILLILQPKIIKANNMKIYTKCIFIEKKNVQFSFTSY